MAPRQQIKTGRQGGARWLVWLSAGILCARTLAYLGAAFAVVRYPSLRAKEPTLHVKPPASTPAQLPHGSIASTTCFSIGVLGTCCLAALGRRNWVKASGATPALPRYAAAPGGTGPQTAVLETSDDKEQFRALCTTLLREVGKAEDILAEGDTNVPNDGALDFVEFEGLLQKLNVSCEEQQAKRLFNMLDEDGSGAVDIAELKSSLRNSGVITEMYNEGITNALLTLIPAVLLAIGFTLYKGTSAGLDFVAGYIVEDSLSVDNLFVFLVVFKYFKVPPALQKTCLDLGIYGAVVLRALFIFLGLAAVNSFKPVLLLFAFILLYASFTSLTGDEDDDDDDEEGPPEFIQDILSKLPTTDTFYGDKLYITDKATGGLLVTPLSLCIITIELSDILFAVDSVPAVFAVTDDPLIVFTSNIAAILGLRSLFQVLSIAVQDLVYLEKSAAVILGFVGLKLVGEVAGFEINSAVSLVVIIVTLLIGILASLAEDSSKDVAVKKKSTIEKLTDAAAKLFRGQE